MSDHWLYQSDSRSDSLDVTPRMCVSPAENVPQTDSPVSTFFEGNIVGAGTHTFLTEDWGADKGADWAHWQKCVCPFVLPSTDVVLCERSVPALTCTHGV